MTPQRLVGSFLLSSEWLISAGITVVGLVLVFAFDVPLAAIGGLIPIMIGAVSLVSRRVIAMFHFTLAESPRGLRVTRGLTNLTSQSVPIDRIQGVKTTQPLLWKRLGWYRVDVDILGYGSSDSENNSSNATSVLLPVATAAEVALAMDRVLPGLDVAAIALHPSPRRARWVRWFDFWTLRYGWDERALVTAHGWLNHVRDVVPHAKTQSVRIEQGPLQRRLRLADVHIDTPKGPVNAVAQELDIATARELALGQLDRARAARAADAQRRTVRDDAAEPREGTPDAEVLAAFGIDRGSLIGGGGETEVYALDQQRVLRLYRQAHGDGDRTVPQLQALYAGWRRADIGLQVPVILEVGERRGRFWTVDRRFDGQNYSAWLRTAGTDERRRSLLTFLDATQRLAMLPSPLGGFARLVGLQAPRQFGSAAELAYDMLEGPTRMSRDRLGEDLPDVAEVWSRLMSDLGARRVEPVLVHGDICPPNAYVTLGSDGGSVTGIGDFSPHTVHGDPMMDLAGAVAFLELERYGEAAEDSAWLEAVVVSRHGCRGEPLDPGVPPLLRLLLLLRLRLRSCAVRLVPAATALPLATARSRLRSGATRWRLGCAAAGPRTARSWERRWAG